MCLAWVINLRTCRVLQVAVKVDSMSESLFSHSAQCDAWFQQISRPIDMFKLFIVEYGCLGLLPCIWGNYRRGQGITWISSTFSTHVAPWESFQGKFMG